MGSYCPLYLTINTNLNIIRKEYSCNDQDKIGSNNGKEYMNIKLYLINNYEYIL